MGSETYSWGELTGHLRTKSFPPFLYSLAMVDSSSHRWHLLGGCWLLLATGVRHHLPDWKNNIIGMNSREKNILSKENWKRSTENRAILRLIWPVWPGGAQVEHPQPQSAPWSIVAYLVWNLPCPAITRKVHWVEHCCWIALILTCPWVSLAWNCPSP